MDFTKIDVNAVRIGAGRYLGERLGAFISEKPEKVVEGAARGAGLLLTSVGESIREAGTLLSLIGAEAGNPANAPALRTELVRLLGYIESASKPSTGSSTVVSSASPTVAPASFEAGAVRPTAERAASLKRELASALADLKAATDRASTVQASLAELLGTDAKP